METGTHRRPSQLSKTCSFASPAVSQATATQSSWRRKGWISLALSAGRKQTLTLSAARYAVARDEKAHTYLAGRGLDASLADRFLLGVVADPEPEHAPYRGMLSIPYRTKTGVVGFKFRHLDNVHEPKYLNPPGQPVRMFNVLATFTDSPLICVAEGEMDAMVAESCGLPCVGVPGVRAWKPHFPKLLDGFEHVVVLADNDEKDDGSNPGRELADAICRDLPQAQTAWLPRGADLNDVFLAGGRDAVAGLLPRLLRVAVDGEVPGVG